jgi:hypothetical protein
MALCIKLQIRVDPTKRFFHKCFFRLLFAIKLGPCVANALFSYVTNTQALQQKLENKEKQGFVRLTPEKNLLRSSQHFLLNDFFTQRETSFVPYGPLNTRPSIMEHIQQNSKALFLI